MKNSKIIISIPAYNEERTIGAVIREIDDALKKGHDYQILVVDDGSTDSTAAVAKKAGAIVFSHQTNQGLAETFRTELQKCLELNAGVIVHIDADRQYVAKEIPKLLRKIDEGYDLVLGSRFKGKIESMSLIKRIGNMAFSKLVSNITRVMISDAQTGFRAFTKDVAEKVKVMSTHTYTQEQIIRAVRQKFRIAEVPIYFRKRRDKSRLMSSPFEYALKAWINLVRIYRDYEPLKFFSYIGLVFFLTGFALGTWILYSLLTTGTVGALPRVMLTVLLISVAVQIWLFGLLADMFRK
ncbi:glycosyltransferase family 2 protein [Candidatus Woesearchaeota archaeon]|nr:glycosyltransferase family 2 protein [Candidatus Woesearchaeota archaeon]